MRHLLPPPPAATDAPVPTLPTHEIRRRGPRVPGPLASAALASVRTRCAHGGGRGAPSLDTPPLFACSVAAGGWPSRAGCHDRPQARGRPCVALSFQFPVGSGQRRGWSCGRGPREQRLRKRRPPEAARLSPQSTVSSAGGCGCHTRSPASRCQRGAPRAGGGAPAVVWLVPPVTIDFSISPRACWPPVSLLW